jgi:hypothetical protein
MASQETLPLIAWKKARVFMEAGTTAGLIEMILPLAWAKSWAETVGFTRRSRKNSLTFSSFKPLIHGIQHEAQPFNQLLRLDLTLCQPVKSFKRGLQQHGKYSLPQTCESQLP